MCCNDGILESEDLGLELLPLGRPCELAVSE